MTGRKTIPRTPARNSEKAIPQRIGKLTLVKVRMVQLPRQRQTMVYARCDCGVATRIALHHWRSQVRQSCRDCARREQTPRAVAALRASKDFIR